MQNLVRWKGNLNKSENTLEHGICKSPCRTEGVKIFLLNPLTSLYCLAKYTLSVRSRQAPKKHDLSQFFALLENRGTKGSVWRLVLSSIMVDFKIKIKKY